MQMIRDEEYGLVFSYEELEILRRLDKEKNMERAILVTDWQGTQELNKLLEAGYKVKTADDNGVYVLECDELEAEQIKNVEHTTKQQHVRIEFDDIRDVPKVWVDGELIAGVNDKSLISLMVDWNTDTDIQHHKEFGIKLL